MSNLSKRSLPLAFAAVSAAALIASLDVSLRAQTPAAAQAVQERGPQPLADSAIQAAIDALGTVDATATEAAFNARMNAARALRRAPADTVTPALIKAVQSHTNPYVRFKALVLLTAF